ncbi:hypothetical protein [Nitratifractor salsuginis]|uniref:Uncharacterized protein n=1 Tax=Nitratifractor salsuginis (strain DSM 16511 / JCM 12458 / E9I37-1) TaxID=749222 RepID=E6WY38_NITSE|nr:hypothetical protein [Nitratifractor salsuginis]ADV46412.1 hypothetical protein Nitsa_1159 [Nitratifractor salsuginis DSM 16511]
MAYFIDRQKDKYRQGISTQQGTNGVAQGGEGWKSQYGQQTNSIINTLTSAAPKFQAPEIKDSLLSQKGFNQALGVVQARNNAKLDMMNRRNLSGVLGSLLGNETRRYGIDTQAGTQRYGIDTRAKTQQGIAALNAKTRIRGQDLDAKMKDKALQESAAYHKIMQDYYTGQLTNQQAKLQLEQAKLNAPRRISPIDEQYKRARILKSAGGIDALIADEHAKNLTNEQKNYITAQYIQKGTLPAGLKLKETHIIGKDDYEPVYVQPKQQEPAPQQQAQQQAPVVTGKLLDSLSKTMGVDRSKFRISDDGRGVVFPDGSVIPASEARKRLGV